MQLEKQVCSLDLAKRLKELGVKQNAYYDWSVPHSQAFNLLAHPNLLGFTPSESATQPPVARSQQWEL
jgi:hypothetical protein